MAYAAYEVRAHGKFTPAFNLLLCIKIKQAARLLKITERMVEEGLYDKLLSLAERDELERKDTAYEANLSRPQTFELIKGGAQLLSRLYAERIEDLAAQLQNSRDSANDKQQELNFKAMQLLQPLLTALKADKAQQPASPLMQLKGLIRRQSRKEGRSLPAAPRVPLMTNYLFAGNRGSNDLLQAIKAESASADAIDLIVSFIKWSGYIKIKQELKDFTARGGQLRIITTTYIGATEARPLIELSHLPNTTIKVCYSALTTRLHAKAYIFKRLSGFGSAYVGSSNLTSPALTSGVEWNLKIAEADDPEIYRQITEAFDYFYASEHFESFTDRPDLVEKLKQALKNEAAGRSSIRQKGFTLTPYNFQQQILDRLTVQREQNHCWRNLVVAATGTGKTVLAAFDFKRFNDHLYSTEHRAARLLFIAHRQEIVEQAQKTFQVVLKDYNFGAVLGGGRRPEHLNDLFATIQSVNSQQLWNKRVPNYYDYIVIDEVHHSAAAGYQQVLNYFKPRILLGLTATPERADGQSIFTYFDNRVSAAIRLPEAIDRGLLCPFSYFGITDELLDLKDVNLNAGDYSVKELEAQLVDNRSISKYHADLAATKLREYWADPDNLAGLKALGFCVSVRHAEFMAQKFNELGIAATALSAQSSPEERGGVQQRLKNGALKIIFSVDLYNEGVDIPEVNAVLFLRPTHSLTIFLQQLGRGLRCCENKSELLVLDFIAPDKRNFSYAMRCQALLKSGSRRSLLEEFYSGFTDLPSGCFMQFEPKASEDVLGIIKDSVNNLTNLSKKFSLLLQAGQQPTLRSFLDRFCLQLEDLYRKKNTFFKIKQKAGLTLGMQPLDEELEKLASRLLNQLSRCDAPALLNFTLKLCEAERLPAFNRRDSKLYAMLKVSCYERDANKHSDADLFAVIKQQTVKSELQELCRYILEERAVKAETLEFEPSLEIYSTYTRAQLLTALNSKKPTSEQSGVSFIDESRINVLFVTLNKDEKLFSRSTMYQDYSINEKLFHWESPNSTRQNSTTAEKLNSPQNKILLCVRLHKENRHGDTMPYTCLGQAFVQHYEGEAPISYTLRMAKEIPAKFMQQTALYQQ